MSLPVAEQYGGKPMAANATLAVPSGSLVAGFLCTVTGTLNFAAAADGSGTKMVDTLPVTVGVYYPIPVSTGEVMAVVLSAGAAGTLFANF